MSNDSPASEKKRGYGNIYTPHAGSMIIQVQRESGLANRTFVLSQWQVQLLRRGIYGVIGLLTVVILSWFYLASQAARVPLLSRRLATMQHDVQRLDTLRTALNSLESRFQQVQRMLGASATAARTASSPEERKASRAAPADSGTPRLWPLPQAGTLLGPPSPEQATPTGIDIAIPLGTEVRAAGTGIITAITNDVGGGRIVRMSHADGYESIYSNLSDVRVVVGSRIEAGTIIGLSGGATGTLPPHLRFEVRRGGAAVNPTSLITKGPDHGDLQ